MVVSKAIRLLEEIAGLMWSFAVEIYLSKLLFPFRFKFSFCQNLLVWVFRQIWLCLGKEQVSSSRLPWMLGLWLNYAFMKKYAYWGRVFGMSSFIIKGWHNISLVVRRDLGSSTKIFFMKSLASSGTLVFYRLINLVLENYTHSSLSFCMSFWPSLSRKAVFRTGKHSR